MPVIINRYHLPVPIIAEHLASQGLQATVPQECIVLIYELSSLLLPRITDCENLYLAPRSHPDKRRDAPRGPPRIRAARHRRASQADPASPRVPAASAAHWPAAECAAKDATRQSGISPPINERMRCADCGSLRAWRTMFVFLFGQRMVSQRCPQILKRCTLLVAGILYSYPASWLGSGNPTL